MQIETYQDHHFAGVKALWEAVFPNDPPYNRAEVSIPAKLLEQPELFFVAMDEGEVVGTVMAGYDGHRGWLHTVAVARSHRHGGIGGKLVNHAVEALKARGCIKVNLQVREGNPVTGFYEKLGFEVEPRTSMGRRI